jgi:hypothetical protein
MKQLNTLYKLSLIERKTAAHAQKISKHINEEVRT